MNQELLLNSTAAKYYGLLFVFYLIAHGGILLIPNAIYWDDWVLYQVEPKVIMDTFRQAGSMFNIAGHMHVLFLSIGPWFYKVVTFVLMFGAGVALDRVIKNYGSVSIETRFLIVLFFLILPFYWARVALIDIVYTVSYFLFFLAWALVSRNRALALILFFLSFNTNSLLVFYALPFVDMYLRSYSSNIGIKSFLFFCSKNFDFFVIPFVFFFIKTKYFPPSDLYEGYNQQYSLYYLISSPFGMLKDWAYFFAGIDWLLVLIFFLIIYFFIRPLLVKKIRGFIGFSALLFAVSMLAIFLAVFPYWVLGHVPTFAEWTSRHQLLLPLGVAIFIVSLLLMFKEKAKVIMLTFLLSLSLMLNVTTYYGFYVDWTKQKLLIKALSEESLVRDADLVIFEDQSKSFNAINRTYRSYEWNGIMANAFRDETRFGINLEDQDRFIKGEFFSGYFTSPEKYRASGFSQGDGLVSVQVNISAERRSFLDIVSGSPILDLKLSTNELPTLSRKQ